MNHFIVKFSFGLGDIHKFNVALGAYQPVQV